jgi:energy-coupling factor transport system ATP-binding protein
LIRAHDLSFKFQRAESPVIRRANFALKAGELCLLTGQTGSGKSTLLKMLNGLAPHFSNGDLHGQLEINGLDMAGKKPHDFAAHIAYVNQQPQQSFVASTVEDELAFGLEQAGIERQMMRSMVAKIADEFQITHLLNRSTDELSGGEQQKVAIAAAMVGGQKILLLDEPTSALDQAATEDLLSLLHKLAKVDEVLVLIAEHRIDRLVEIADSSIAVFKDGSVVHTILSPDSRLELTRNQDSEFNIVDHSSAFGDRPRFELEQITIEIGGIQLVEDSSLKLVAGEVAAIVGPNGIGKSSLLWHIHQRGSSSKKIALVTQNASDVLILRSISRELQDSDSRAGVASGTTGAIFETLAGRLNPSIHPHDLSAGQQVALSLAIQLASNTEVVLLDEPTRGLDLAAKRQLANLLNRITAEGKYVLIASHDSKFVEQVARRVFTIDDRKIVELPK